MASKCHACEERIPEGMIVCSRDWRYVPVPLRRRLNRSYRRLERDRNNANIRAAVLAARQAVREAVDAARAPARAG